MGSCQAGWREDAFADSSTGRDGQADPGKDESDGHDGDDVDHGDGDGDHDIDDDIGDDGDDDEDLEGGKEHPLLIIGATQDLVVQ